MSDPRIALVGRTYNEIADRFVEWQGDCEDDPRGWWREQLMSRLHEGACVLELGCGAGLLDTRVLADRFAVTGVDISAEQIARARANVPAATFMTFFSGFPPDANRHLLTQAGFQLELDEVVTLREPEGDMTFHWILGRT